MGRRILSVIAGLITGFIIVYVGEAATHILFPPPSGIDFNNKEVLHEFIKSLPTKVFILILAFWLLAAFTGGFVAAKINRTGWKQSSIITGSVLWAATILNLILIPHPIWMVIIAIGLIVPSSYFGGKLAS